MIHAHYAAMCRGFGGDQLAVIGRKSHWLFDVNVDARAQALQSRRNVILRLRQHVNYIEARALQHLLQGRICMGDAILLGERPRSLLLQVADGDDLYAAQQSKRIGVFRRNSAGANKPYPIIA